MAQPLDKVGGASLQCLTGERLPVGDPVVAQQAIGGRVQSERTGCHVIDPVGKTDQVVARHRHQRDHLLHGIDHPAQHLATERHSMIGVDRGHFPALHGIGHMFPQAPGVAVHGSGHHVDRHLSQPFP
ncbi:hypothetical protein D3C85_1117390 [compost metagenome]